MSKKILKLASVLMLPLAFVLYLSQNTYAEKYTQHCMTLSATRTIESTGEEKPEELEVCAMNYDGDKQTKKSYFKFGKKNDEFANAIGLRIQDGKLYLPAPYSPKDYSSAAFNDSYSYSIANGVPEIVIKCVPRSNTTSTSSSSCATSKEMKEEGTFTNLKSILKSRLEGITNGRKNCGTDKDPVECIFKDPTVTEVNNTETDEAQDRTSPGTAEGDPNSNTGEQEEQKQDPDIEEACYNKGVVSLSWLVCPAIANATNTASPLEQAIQGLLEVRSNLYSTYMEDGGDQSPAYQVWQIIRNVANILMVLFFLVIIISQITGIGIDNYGIKKLLPKVIIAAILINFSFIICQLAIDLSNILGSGLMHLFQNIAGTLDKNLGAESLIEMVSVILGATASVGALTTVTLAASGVSGDGVMVAVILVLALIVALIAILLFFVMLGARMVIIIACIALSPIAFAFNLLPNTQPFFKKWWRVFEACLVIYPLCGAVYGLSAIIRAIVFGAGGKIQFWEGIVAVVAPFLPFFFIPTLLKNAISSLGVVGGALLTMGNGVRNGVRSGVNGIQNSERFKARAEDARQYTAGVRAQRRYADLMQRNKKRGGTDNDLNGLSARQRRELDRVTKQSLQHEQRVSNAKLNTQNRYDAALAGMEAQAQAEREQNFTSLLAAGKLNDANGDVIDPNDVNSISRALALGLANGQDEDMTAALYQSLLGKGNKGLKGIEDVINGDCKDKDGSSIAAPRYNAATNRVINDIVGNKDIKNNAQSTYETVASWQKEIRQSREIARQGNPNITEEEENREVSQGFNASVSAGMVQQRINDGTDIGKIKTEQIPDITDKQFDGLVANTTHQDRQTQQNAVNILESAVNDEHIFNRMDGEKRQKSVDALSNHIVNNYNPQRAYEFMHSKSFRYASAQHQAAIRNQAARYKPPRS